MKSHGTRKCPGGTGKLVETACMANILMIQYDISDAMCVCVRVKIK